MTNAEKCMAACDKSLQENEYNMRKIRGVNMSHSDVETARFYASTIKENGTYVGILMKPRNEVAALLDKFGLLMD